MIVSRVAPSLALAVGATLTPNGCGDRAPMQSTVTVHDSAGITIVENEPGGGWREGEGWRLSDEPVLDIGVIEGDEAYELHNAWDALRLSDGRIVVANSGTHELRFYASDGSHIRSVGRQGGGPGEFRVINGLDRLPGDTIAVWDPRALRVSYFASDGEFVRSVSPALADEGFEWEHYGTFADGSFVLRPTVVPGAGGSDGLRRDTTAYTRYGGADGALLDTLAVTPGREVAVIQSDENGFSFNIIQIGRAHV